MQLFRRSTITLLLALPVALTSTTAAWAEKEQEKRDSYRLEQMRQQSQSKEKEPEVQMPANEPDLMAGSDSDVSEEYEKDASDVGDIKPKFDKPKLEPYKADE